jgi:hypothetical protein
MSHRAPLSAARLAQIYDENPTLGKFNKYSAFSPAILCDSTRFFVIHSSALFRAIHLAICVELVDTRAVAAIERWSINEDLKRFRSQIRCNSSGKENVLERVPGRL